MVNIALAYSKFATSQSGGARESLLTLLDGVSEKVQITVDVYQTPPVDDPPNTNFEYKIHSTSVQKVPKLTWANQVISRFQWGRYLKQQLSSDYDLLITQGSLGPASVHVANELNISSVFFVRSLALTGYEKYWPNLGHGTSLLQTDLGGMIQYPFLWKNFHDYQQAASEATQTISNSEFTASKINQLFDTESTIIYPPIKLSQYLIKYNTEGSITMVNPRAAYKGADIFLNIADQMTDETFLLVGPISSEAIQNRTEKMPNVSHWEWCEDMREAYAESKLVVVPSRGEEPFGRVAAEAMVSGIPCVVSNRGGLPEVVGDTGEIVRQIEAIDQWTTAVQKALSDHDPQAQRQRVERFSAERQVNKLFSVIDSLVESTND